MAFASLVSALRPAPAADLTDAQALARRLEAMPEPDRVAFVRGLRKVDMEALWQACDGRAVGVDDFVPAGTRLGREIIHAGKNSLPAFTHFEKRFTAADGQPGEVYGYNHTPWTALTAGPGYFVGRLDATFGAFGLDYYRVPPESAPLPASWPRVRDNRFGLSRFIYAEMIDYMRRVCDGVTIGRAWRKGQMTDNYFVLARTSG